MSHPWWKCVRVCLAGLILAGFWGLLVRHLTLPAWQVAILPAALAGAVLGWGQKENRYELGLWIVAAIASACTGELLLFAGDLARRVEAAYGSRQPDALLAAIAERERSAESKVPGPAAPPRLPAAPVVDYVSAACLYVRGWRGHLGPLAATLALSLLGAIGAGRRTSHPVRDEAQPAITHGPQSR